jgi:hypothetical protein
MYDLNPRKVKIAIDAAPILAAIDAGLAAQEDKRREYLGASQIGDDCQRRIQYDLLGAPGDPFDPRTRRIFARGHIVEELVAKWLRQGGFELSTHTPHGQQHGFSTAGGRFRGHIDGVLMAGPGGLEYPALWENKALGAKSWADVQRRGVAASKPIYADQMAIYQAYLNLPAPALFTAVNCDTMEIHAELVPFDAARAQKASDRAVHILRATDAGDLLPRVADKPDGFPCSFCRYRTHCWGN